MFFRSPAIKLFAFLAGLLFLSGCGAPTDSNTLIVGSDLSYPPFETIAADGTPSGVSVDLAKALGEKLGRPVVIENIPFVGLIPALQSKRVDLIISSMTDTPERRQSIGFSVPYLTVGLALLAGKNSGLSGAGDLDAPNRTIVVRQGTTGEVWARNTLKNARILAVEKESSAVLEVVQGKADAFVYDQMSVWENARRHSDTTVAILAPVQKENWAIGIRKDNGTLTAAVNEALGELKESDFFETVGDKYLSEQKAAFESQGVPFVF
jgi:polar amino acid transport system substrate-binding protein